MLSHCDVCGPSAVKCEFSSLWGVVNLDVHSTSLIICHGCRCRILLVSRCKWPCR